MERAHAPIRRGLSWSAVRVGTEDQTAPPRPGLDPPEKKQHDWVRAKPSETTILSPPQPKTNLGRSASLSEKELKEARTRSQIIAEQLTVSSNSKSRGVQLFHRRRQRVNAFTLVSVAGEGEAGHQGSQNEPGSPSAGALTGDTESPDLIVRPSRDVKQKNNIAEVLRPTFYKMEETGEVKREVGDVEASMQDRHFLPVNEKDEEISVELTTEHEESVDQFISSDDTAGPGSVHRGAVEINGTNGSHGPVFSGSSSNQSSIINKTARPFCSAFTEASAGPIGGTSDIPPPPLYSTPPLPPFESSSSSYSATEQQAQTQSQPHFAVSSRQRFSSPPPAPTYPTPPLPQSIPFDAHPFSAMSPPPISTHCMSPTPPYSTYTPQFLPESRSETPTRTGLLDESRVRRTNRKSMFTFQEKPKLSPNPDLLSMVQRTDQIRRGRDQSEVLQEEEQMALGAEASNFLAKEPKGESGEKESVVPEWTSALKSSKPLARVEHKPEQALTNVSGKGAELFAKRQSRMERYVHEKPDKLRSPSPTMSLPPSWVYPSNMPGRVKAIVSASNIGAEISKTLQVQQASQQKNFPVKAPVPAPAPTPEPDNTELENGCSRIEMELSRHQPYQLKSSLFIFNPPKDPLSTLPKAAPPPKPVLTGSSYFRQTSLPPTPHYDSSDSYRSAHCFSPPMMPLGSLSGGVTSPASGSEPDRVTSPRTVVQAPKPTFSTKRAGIAPQVTESSTKSSNTPTPWTPNLSRRLSNIDKPPSAVCSPNNQLVAPTPRRPSPASVPSTPTSRSFSYSVPSSPTPQSIHSPGTYSPALKAINNPVTSSPNTQPVQSPICTSPSPKPFSRSSTFSPTPRPIQSPIRSFQSPVSSRPLPRSTNNHAASTPISPPWETTYTSPVPLQDTKANHRLLAKNIINAAKRKNSPSPGALGGRGLPMSPGGSSIILPFESKSVSPFHSHSLSAQSPTFTSPPATPTHMVRSPLRLYTTRSLTDSDASLESEDSGVRSPGAHRTYNTCPRGWTGSLRLKTVGGSEDL